MTRRVAQDEVGADSGTPQEGALVEAEAIREALRSAMVGEWGQQNALASLDSLLAYIKQLDATIEQLRKVCGITATSTSAGVLTLLQRAEAAEAQVKQLEQQNSLGSAPGEGSPYASVEAERIRAGLRPCEDAISQAIGEGCGECWGCQAYAALGRLLAYIKQLEKDKLVIEIDLATEAEFYKARVEQLEGERDGLRNLLARIRQWDVLNPPPDPVPAPFGDLPYWIAEIDVALARTEERTP